MHPDRTPPRSLPWTEDGERGVLCCLLLSPSLVDEVRDELPSEAFYLPANQTVYETVKTLVDEKTPVHFGSVKDRLQKHGQLDEIGGTAYLDELYSFLPTAGVFDYYLEQVKTQWALRTLVQECTRITRQVYDREIDNPTDAISAVDQLSVRLSGHQRVEIVEYKEHVRAALEDIEARTRPETRRKGITFGITGIDAELSGLEPSEMLVIGGKPGDGKTAITMQMVDHAAGQLGVRCAVFSLEMKASQLAMRHLAYRGEVSIKTMRRGETSPAQLDQLGRVGALLMAHGIYVGDRHGINMPSIASQARRLKSKNNISLIVIDFVQLIEAASRHRQDTMETIVAQNARDCKNLAKELDCGVVLLSQLNEDGALKAARAIGEAADHVGKILTPCKARDEYREFQVAKGRGDGRGMNIPLHFEGALMRFSDWPTGWPRPQADPPPNSRRR